MKFTDIISPFLAWSRAARKADTIPYPDCDHPGSARYRGFHRNDLEKCIGCGRCEEVCQNVAIDMVPAGDDLPEKGDSGLRPLVDYGRCCWCALCVDVCSTGSLSMSNSYSWSTADGDSCTYVPGVDARPWDDGERGYRQDQETLGWAGSPRVEMPVADPGQRVDGFDEVVRGYREDQAVAEATRCIQCGLCVTACPAHMHIPEYIDAIARGDSARAVRLFYDNNPLPEMCGKVCTRECEKVCALGHQGEAIAIRWLKRFATERFESLADVLGAGARPAARRAGRVAVIGSGPAGLSAAYYLARMGYEAHVYDRDPRAGGVARHAIPRYRLPEGSFEKQQEVFERAGISFHYGRDLGAEEVHSLSRSHDAVFIAAGLQKGSEFPLRGSGLPGVRQALDFLRGDPESEAGSIGGRVVVIGGGNVAMDTARTCRRLGAEVVVSYRRRIVDMPADEEEIREAVEEGVDIRPQTIPAGMERTDGGLRYSYLEAKMVPGRDGGRPKPVPRDEVEHPILADTVFMAIGQIPDLGFIPGELEGSIDIRHGRIQVDADQYTGVANIYAGGDITPGAGDIVTAVADGMRAARAIARRLSKKSE